MSINDIWYLARRPFVLPQTPRVLHVCKWEVFAYDRAGCTVCGTIHTCDQLTCKHQIITDDSILCSITGSFLNKIYGTETWSDRTVCSSMDKKCVTELSYDIETHVNDLLLSNNAKRCAKFEQDNYTSRLLYAVDACSNGSQCECVADVFAHVLQRVTLRIPLEFCEVDRNALKKQCLLAINASAAVLFKNKHFKICRANQKQIVFGLVYLLRTGVTNDGAVILPMMQDLCSVLPLEAHLKSFFRVNPSSITDTENRLKFVIRQGMDVSAV